MTTLDPLAELAYWNIWQQCVVEGLPNFAAQGMYVEQESVDPNEVTGVLTNLLCFEDLPGMDRDVRYGGRKFYTLIGTVTRMWVDGNVEIDFLRRKLDDLKSLDVLDIGAGYGRLAVMLAPLVNSYACVDSVRVSSIICRYYTSMHSSHPIEVYDTTQFRDTMSSLHPSLAINIHSWNECSLSQISRWLDVLDDLGTRWLFTVSHGRNIDDTSYLTCEKGEPSFKPLLQDRYKLVVEENIGIGMHPHALWKRR